MKLFLDCSMGASGDMLMAALYELLPDRGEFRKKMELLGLSGVTLEYSDSIKCGIKGTHISVKIGGVDEISEDVFTHDHGNGNDHDHGHIHDHEHDHSHNHGNGHEHSNNHSHDHDHNPITLNSQSSAPHARSERRYEFDEILDLIRELDLPDNVIENAIGVFMILGEAEAAVHSAELKKAHLHEVGSLDAVADIVGCCLLINMLGVTDIAASPVHVGSGFIKCEHGILPVPAPATAEILKGIPIYGGQIRGELCTPTGAALLKRFVTRFGNLMPMKVAKIGHGMGTKDFEAANCIRAFLYEDASSGGDALDRDNVYEISCNLDDMTPEAIGAVFGLLLENGALDVYTTPINMKKNRPAVMLSCLCMPKSRDVIARLILEHTSTLGVRITMCQREVLSRTIIAVSTDYGDIRVKLAEGFGIIKNKPEYDDVLAAATLHGVPFMTVYDAAIRALRSAAATQGNMDIGHKE